MFRGHIAAFHYTRLGLIDMQMKANRIFKPADEAHA
jgi:hypothetical protein